MAARILIVEDERITAEDLRDILVDLGYSVTGVVSSGADAIQRAEETAPDLVLMDIRIKGEMDGTETAKILRQRFDLPVVYLTAHADRETLNRAKVAEPLGYIIKPFQESELHATVEIALHKHNQDRKSREREELLASTLRAIGEGIISLDQSGHITLLNPAAEAWTGWTRQAAVGQSITRVFPLMQSGGSPVDIPLLRVLNEGHLEPLADDVLLVSGAGERRPVGGTIAPIRDHEGAVTGAVLVFGAAPAQSGTRRKAASDPESEGIGLGGFKVIAASPVMKQVLNFARRVAESEATPILLEGESGTGKDVLAQFMHNFGKRHSGPFIPLNCAAIPDTLLESELFGYEKGAFTDARAQKRGILEMASGGTIFLDEIGEMPLLVQAKMLRVLEEQSFRRLGGTQDVHIDVRVMAATNRKLSEAIQQGRFRLDLFYRLNVIQLVLPPLRERREDILPLAEFFIRHYNQKFHREVQGLTAAAAAGMRSYAWPGNVRELRNKIERAMVLDEGDLLQLSSLQLDGPPEPTGVSLRRLPRRRRRTPAWRKPRERC